MSWTVQLDAGADAALAGRVMLDLNSGPIRVAQGGLDFGEAQIQSYLADGRIGSSSVDYRIPNRVVTIPLGLGMDDSGTEETVRAQLQQKVALLQREGGWLLRQRAGGPAMYADIVDASLTLPDVWGETGGVEDKVVLTLTCKPDFFGDEVTLDPITATGVLVSKLKASSADAVVAGDYPVRCRITVSDTSGHDQHGLLWGVRSRHYDSAATAALTYEAEALTGLNTTASATLAGASGGSVMTNSALQAGLWLPILSTTLSSGSSALTHTGSYRVWVRAYSPSAAPQVSLAWGVGSLAVPVLNDAVTLPGSGAFYLLDLGEVRLDAPPVGAQKWYGAIQALGVNTNDSISIDKLFLQPLDECAGVLTSNPQAPVSSVAVTHSPTTGADDSATGTMAWGGASKITAQDGSTADNGGIGTGVTHYVKGTGYGFAIPSAATIQGIQVSVRRLGDVASAVADNAVRLVKAGTVQATDRSAAGVYWPTTLTTQIYGSPTDLWGGTWAPADINNSGFGAAVSASITGFAKVHVDYISVTVYYVLATGFTIAQDAVVYANEVAELRTDGMFRADPTGSVYGPVSQVLGDLPRLPPSGLEGRPCELFLRPTRGDLATQPDVGLDGFTATPIYRPAWLSRP